MEPIVFIIQQAQIRSLKRKHEKRVKAIERPDITHQCLLTLLDSPLNMAGKLRVYIHTKENVLIEINPATRIPRTLSRFMGLMDQLLCKLKIRSGTGEVLLRVVKNPVSLHLTPNTVKVSLSKNGTKMDKKYLEKTLGRGYAFFINAISSGKDICEDAEVTMKVSDFGLSAAVCCAKVCNMFEEIYNIF